MSQPNAWLIFHGIDYGGREDCSIFYAPSELYDDEIVANDRVKELKDHFRANNPKEDWYVELQPFVMNEKTEIQGTD